MAHCGYDDLKNHGAIAAVNVAALSSQNTKVALI